MTASTFRKEGTNSEDVQEMNRSLIIKLLRQRTICSRADLAKETGLKRATITHIVADLIDWGLVKEVGVIAGTAGRRSIGITINSEIFKVIGLRLARKYFSVGLYDIGGTEYQMHTEVIDPDSDSRETFKRMKKIIAGYLKTDQHSHFLGIGCAIPGPFFRDEGKMALITELTGWEKIPIKEELEADFELPVYLEHDANLGGLAEWWLGAKRRKRGILAYVAAGQGIGAGIVIDGQVFRGSLGVAGEIGHISINFDGPKCSCGNTGCLTNYCSTVALIKTVNQKRPDYPQSMLPFDPTFKSIVDAYRQDDELAVYAFTQTADYLACGLVNIIYAYNPDVIIIGDDMTQFGNPLLERCLARVKQHVLPHLFEQVRICLTSFEQDPVIVGAGLLVVDRILSKPAFIHQLTR